MENKNKIGRILFVILSLFAFVFPKEVLAANPIESIHITADIQADGSVIIKDHRIFNAEEGTEHYLSLGNLDDSELLDFTVYDENGQPLEDIGEWDVDASFEEKAGKYGVNYVGNEIELCFGLGGYGRREFTVEYHLSNFVKDLEDDHQAFYWQFINPYMDPIDTIQIDVTTNTDYLFENPATRFWAFGHEGGTTEITSEALVMNSGEWFDQSEYVVLLGIFEGAPFQTNSNLSETSESLIEMAMSGATLDGTTYDDYLDGMFDDQSTSSSGIASFIIGAIIRIFGFILIVGTFIGIGSSSKKRNEGKFRTTVSEDQYFRDIPYDGQFIHTQYFLDNEISDWISSFILKWVSEGRLQDSVEEVGLIFKKDKLALIINTEAPSPENKIEARLWAMVLKAAGDDRILSEKEFNRYVRRNLSTFDSWIETVKEDSKDQMEAEGYLEAMTTKVLGIFNQESITITTDGQQLGDHIEAFKNYLVDFSLIHEREVSHVVLWQEMMIWAAYMGIAEEVYDQLKIVNPEIERQMPYSPRTVIMANNFAHSVQSTHSSASSSSSSYSGGGGSSFGGGGGGSFGGGSGGGTR